MAIQLSGQEKVGKGKDLQLVTFRLGDEEFAADILKVQEIIKIPDITRVPNAPSFVEGVINLRGKVIPIIDLRRRFGLSEVERDKEARIIVVDSSGKVVGLVVDSVSEVLRLPLSTVEPPLAITGGIESEYIDGVGKLGDRLVILMNLDKVLTEREHSAIEGMKGSLPAHREVGVGA